MLHGLSAPPESSSGLRRLSRTGEEEGDGGGDDDWRLWPPPQHRGCLSLLSLSPLSLSLAPLMPPLLFSSLYLVSLCASTAGFDRVFRVWGVGYVAVQDALARGSRHSTSRDSSVVAGGRSGAVRPAGAAGDPRRGGKARYESEWSVRGGEGGAQELRSVAEQMHCVLLHSLRLPLPAPPASYRLPQKELVARLPDGAAVHWRRGGDRWRRRRAPVRKPRATPPALPVPLRLDRSLAVLGAVAISCRRPTPSATSHRRQPACTERNRRRCRARQRS